MKRAQVSAAKRSNFVARPKMWIRRSTLERILDWIENHIEFAVYGLLCLLAYAFLVRLPSEALPAQKGGEGQACLHREGDKIKLKLRRRCF